MNATVRVSILGLPVTGLRRRATPKSSLSTCCKTGSVEITSTLVSEGTSSEPLLAKVAAWAGAAAQTASNRIKKRNRRTLNI